MEKQKSNRTLKEIISECAEKEFSKYPKKTITPEELKQMAEKRKSKSKKK